MMLVVEAVKIATKSDHWATGSTGAPPRVHLRQSVCFASRPQTVGAYERDVRRLHPGLYSQLLTRAPVTSYAHVDYRGLKYVSMDRTKRISAIASFLSSAPYGIVCLQELWVQADQTMCLSVSSQLPFVRLFHRYVSHPRLTRFVRRSDTPVSLQ